MCSLSYLCSDTLCLYGSSEEAVHNLIKTPEMTIHDLLRRLGWSRALTKEGNDKPRGDLSQTGCVRSEGQYGAQKSQPQRTGGACKTLADRSATERELENYEAKDTNAQSGCSRKVRASPEAMQHSAI